MGLDGLEFDVGDVMQVPQSDFNRQSWTFDGQSFAVHGNLRARASATGSIGRYRTR